MTPNTRRLMFGRINRRAERDTLDLRPFSGDMALLAESHLTRHHEKGTAQRAPRTWQAADMTVTPSGDFLTGVLGYSEREQHVDFDPEAWSWLKGETSDSDAATDATMTPFAVDLRDDQRWIAFAVTGRLQPYTFKRGFQLVLNEAATRLQLIPSTWEVDLITSIRRIREWLDQNPRVHLMVRTVKFTNPGRDLDGDRTEMRALAASRKTEEFKASRGKTLDVDSDEFNEKLRGAETGDLDVRLESRGAHGATEAKFSTRTNMDESTVSDFGSDLVAGLDAVLRSLREYVASRDTEQEPLTLDEH